MASIKPYQFEPESDPDNVSEDDRAEPVQERLFQNVLLLSHYFLDTLLFNCTNY